MFYFLNESFWSNPALLLLFLLSIACLMFTRYFLSTWLYARILSVVTGSKRNSYVLKRKQISREIKWSIFSSIVFTFLSVAAYWAYQHGFTKLYTAVEDYSLAYLCISPFLLIVAYESYYYWLHRFMHLPGVFKYVHKVHHQSIHPTVFTSFSFHPVEAMLQFLFFPIIIMIIPFHFLCVLAVFLLMTVSAVVNHSGVELFKNRFLLKHIIGSTHHDVHHQNFKSNYGLYFTWWDKWMNTEFDTQSKRVK